MGQRDDNGVNPLQLENIVEKENVIKSQNILSINNSAYLRLVPFSSFWTIDFISCNVEH
jgi:hypothetical protein